MISNLYWYTLHLNFLGQVYIRYSQGGDVDIDQCITQVIFAWSKKTKQKPKNLKVQNFEHWKFFHILFILLCLETFNMKISNKENKNNIKMVS